MKIISSMDVTLIASIIAALSSIICVLISVFKTNRTSNRIAFIQEITRERINWLNNIKKLVGKSLSLTYCSNEDNSDMIEILNKIHPTMAKLEDEIIFQLNPKEDKEYIESLHNFFNTYRKTLITLNSNDKDNIAVDVYTFIAARDGFKIESQILFKTEWERIKHEAEGTDFDSKTYKENLKKSLDNILF